MPTEMLLTVAIAVAMYGALVPLAYLIALRRDAAVGFWVCGLAFSVSWFADAFALANAGSWGAVPGYMVVQAFLFAVAFLKGPELWLPIGLYVLVGWTLWLLMMRHRLDGPPYDAFMAWWWPYQSVRLASFGLFVLAARKVRVG